MYRDLFHRDRDVAMLGNAIAAHREALTTTRDGDPTRPVRLFNLGTALTDRHGYSADRAALEEAAGHLRAAARTVPASSRHRPMYLATAGTALCEASELNGNDAMFAEGVALLRDAVASAAPDDPRWPGYLHRLGNVARTRYLRTSEPAARDEAIDAYQRAAAAAPATDPDRLANLRAAMAMTVLRAEDSQEAGHIGQAAKILGEVLALLPPDAADRASVLVLQGRVATLRFQLTNDPADLTAAAVSYRQATSGTLDPVELRKIHAALGSALWTRYERTGDPAGLDEVITAARQASYRPPGGGAPTEDNLTLLAIALTEQHRHTGEQVLLDEAIATLRRAVEVADPSRRPVAWSNLAEALREGSRQRQDPRMLAEAVRLLRDSVRSTRQDDRRRPDFLSHLCRALAEMFGWTGEQADLDEAIAAGRDAVDEARAAGTDQILGLTNLTAALTRRFEHFGDAENLDEVIDTLRQAEADPPASPRERATVLVSLGNALALRFEQTGETTDLADSVTSLRAAADQLPAGHPDRPPLLGNLGGVLLLSARTQRDAAAAGAAQARAAHARNGGDGAADAGLAFDDAAAVLRQAANATPEGHQNRPVYLANLGSALLDRFHLRRDAGDLDDALAVLRQAAGSQPADGTLGQQAGYLLSMARALSEDAIRQSTEAPLTEAISMLRAAATAEAAPTADRIQAAREWGNLAAASDVADAAEGYATAIGLLDLLAWRGLRRVDQERMAAQFSGMAGDAAATAIAAGQPGRAVEMLEQGRGVLLAQAIGARTPHDELRRQAPELADRLITVADALDEPLRSSEAALTVPAADSQRTGERRYAAARERIALLAEIRARPDFADFLKPPSAAGLLGAARLGPVVTINVSRHRCDALVLSSGGIQLIPLPNLSHIDVQGRVTGFQGALDVLQILMGADTDTAGVLAARHVIADTLRWSWDVITGPVLDGLGITGRPERGGPWPRIWWCPTGLLSFLPLHAAGHHDTRDTPVPTTVVDRVISSYTPTARVLLHALQGPAGAQPSGRTLEAPLIVAMPATPGATDLPDSQREANYLISGNPDGQVLTGPEATRGAVLSAIPQASWIHFACHGVQDRAQPARNRLLLHDGPLAIQEIAAGRADQAELAYLSACETFSGGTDLPDEAVTLATSMQLAGYRHVIGAQWPVADGIAPDMARRVYAGIRENGPADTALAVHDAVRALRRDWPDAPAVWAPYVHVGP